MLEQILPLVKQYQTALVILASRRIGYTEQCGQKGGDNLNHCGEGPGSGHRY